MTLFIIMFAVFIYVMVGGVIRGTENAFVEPNKRVKSSDPRFILDVLLWPIWFFILGGVGLLKVAEHSAKLAEERVQDLRDHHIIEIGGVTEGEIQERPKLME